MNVRAVLRRAGWPAAGAAAVLVFVALVARFHHPVFGFTVFLQLDAGSAAHRDAAFRGLPVFVHHGTGGYDGLYYALLALDPTLRDPAAAGALDDPAYRARRILAPALAWLAGAGQPHRIVPLYAALNIAVWLALAAVLWRLFAVDDLRRWLAWAGTLFAAGTLGSVRLALTDNLALLLLAAALLATETGRGRLALACIAAAALARETALLGVVLLLRPPWFAPRQAARLALAAVPLLGWLLCVRLQLGSGNPGWGNFAIPGLGLLEKIRDSAAALATVGDRPLVWSSLLATVALAAQAAWFLTRFPVGDPAGRLGLVFAGLLLSLGTAVWEGFPGAATRVLLPLQLAFNFALRRAGTPLLWLLAGNLSVFSGLLALRDVPQQPDELVAQRVGGTAAVVRFAADWHGRESSGRHVWLWTAARGTLQLETVRAGAAPDAPGPRTLQFSLRSLAPRPVTLHLDGRPLWQGEAGPRLVAHTVELPVPLPREVRLEFSSPAPPVPENDLPGARGLGFAVYDVTLR